MENTQVKRVSREEFEVLDEIGRGGSAVVYRVREKTTGNIYAMKTAREGKERIVQEEAEVLFKVRRSGIPALYAELDTQDGFVMELVEGTSLLEALSSGRLFTSEEAAGAGIQFCEILQGLHSMDPPRIYRDFKPSNIIVKKDGTYAVVDYGAVRAFREGASQDTHRLGTEGYAAPEQYGGWEQSDVRTDVYGIGAVLHSMITGKPPLETGLCPIGEILLGEEGSVMEKILLRCCSVSPSMRYSSLEELKRALKRVQSRKGRRARGLRGRDREAAWKRFVLAGWLSFGCFLGSGIFAAASSGVRSAQYYGQIEAAGRMNGLWDKADCYQEAVQVMPLATEAYLSFAGEAAADGVITAEETEALGSLFYASPELEKLRNLKPGAYAKMQRKVGELFFVYGRDQREMTRQLWANAAAAFGASGQDRKMAKAMCEVLSDRRTGSRASSWLFLEKESVKAALRDGDGNFAAAVCAAAAGEVAVCPDLYTGTGTEEAEMKEVTQYARRMLEMVDDGSGRVKVCARLREELAAALGASKNSTGQGSLCEP